MTLNGEMAIIVRHFSEFGNSLILNYFTKFVYAPVAKQLLGLRRFQNLLLIVYYDHINTICAIIQRLFRQNKLWYVRVMDVGA